MKQTRWQNPQINELFKVIGNLKTSGDMAKFFRDLCTIDELREMARRWQAAQLINKKMPYRTVAARTGLSTATVTRVAYWLNEGAGGYRRAIKRLKKR